MYRRREPRSVVPIIVIAIILAILFLVYEQWFAPDDVVPASPMLLPTIPVSGLESLDERVQPTIEFTPDIGAEFD